MKINGIVNGLIPQSYWASGLECSECQHKLKSNTIDVYKKKSQALNALRRQIAHTPFHAKTFTGYNECDKYILNLNEEGVFSDLKASNEDVFTAIMRLASLSEAFHWSLENPLNNENLKHRIFKAISYYCKKEADREDLGATRFHSSIFAIPVATTNIFFFFLDDMEQVENGVISDSLNVEVYTQLLRCSLQAWTLPLRGDHTDKHPLSPERFRKNVWWVGGNAITYRPVYQVAVMFKSVEMIDTLAYVMSHFLTPTSHTNKNESFWNEGICADGFGWGHGPQAYNSGYPKDGVLSGLRIIKDLKGTPWEKEINYENVDWLLNFIRGISWSQYKGCNAPMQSRHIFNKHLKNDIGYIFDMAELVIENFKNILTKEQLKEMNDILDKKDIEKLDGYPLGFYKGARYFWNNDDLIKKTNEFYFYVNMASNRCDGVEMAHIMADKLNFFTADGSYVFAKDCDEWQESKGAWKLTSLPGITARQVETDKLLPEVNWSGYNSVHPFAGGVARGENGVAGFVFEKNSGRKADGAGVTRNDCSKEIFGVKAYKSYFIFDDTIVCLGSGISDKQQDLGSEIWTTINQTKWATNISYHKAGSSSVETLNLDDKGLNLTLDACGSNGDIPWVKQNGILYAVFAEHTSGEVQVLAEERKTHWELLNFNNSKADNEGCKVFQMWINHGEAPVESKYSYLMYAGSEDPQAYLKSNPVNIIDNSTRLQAVANINNSIVQAVFYDKEAICEAETFKMKVSEPAVVMLEQQEEKLFVTVSDPYQNVNLDELKISLTIPVKGEGITIESEWCVIPIKMPEKPEIGKPITIVVNNCF